jgi:hypothetical protein
MNKLWIFGCSFSNDSYFPRTNLGWFDYVAEEFGLECINLSKAGYGWAHHKNILYEHLSYIEDNDMVILQSSHLLRMYSEFLQTRFEKFRYHPHTDCIIEKNDEFYLKNLLYITKDLDKIREENWNQFLVSLDILNKFLKRWYWWSFEFYPIHYTINDFINYKFGDRLLKFENNIQTFDEWMRLNPRYCINPPNDLHQTYECHEVQGRLFIEQIRNYEEKIKGSGIY